MTPPATPERGDDAQGQHVAETPVTAEQATTSATGGGEAFKEITRGLTDPELASPGVQKLILELLRRAEGRCTVLEGYEERFHGADKRADVAEEKLKGSEERLKGQARFEVLYSCSLGAGFAIIGLAPFFWDEKNSRGPIALAFGIVWVTGCVIAKLVK